MSNTFFTADNHFFHANIIKYCNRPFSSMEEMNETMIERWNKKVKPNDVVYHLGDFSFDRPLPEFHLFIQRLNGNKFITTGDHDDIIYKYDKYMHTGSHPSYSSFQMFQQKVLRVVINNVNIYCLHWKMEVWPRSHYNSFHLFGHSHSQRQPTGKSWDVGVDNNNFEPLSFEEIVQIMKNRPDNDNLVQSHINH